MDEQRTNTIALLVNAMGEALKVLESSVSEGNKERAYQAKKEILNFQKEMSLLVKNGS